MFACLHAGKVDGWRVRKVAAATRKFTLVQAAEADRRHVNLWPLGNGVAGISGTLSAEDAQRLDQRLNEIVGWLRFLGDERSNDVLRSVATGYLAEPDSYTMLRDQVVRARAAASDTRDIHDNVADELTAPNRCSRASLVASSR